MSFFKDCLKRGRSEHTSVQEAAVSAEAFELKKKRIISQIPQFLIFLLAYLDFVFLLPTYHEILTSYPGAAFLPLCRL
jgi:hypothetical protein